MPQPENDNRIRGFDVARAFAVFGMVIVNFNMVAGAPWSGIIGWFYQTFLEGRAAALFVILAGIGIARLVGNPGVQSAIEFRKKQLLLVPRAILLIVLGLVFAPIWPADILHFYGFYMLCSVPFLRFGDRGLFAAAAIFMVGWLLMHLVVNYDQGWDWETFHYQDFWTIKGMLRHIFFNGFHPVFPWAAFMIFGYWLGRLDFRSSTKRRRYFRNALAVFIGLSVASALVVYALEHFFDPEVAGELSLLLMLGPIPPMPQYLVAGSSLALGVICWCIGVAQKFPNHWLIRLLERTGQMSLSIYLAHIILGMGCLQSMGWLDAKNPGLALSSAIAFNSLSAFFAYLYLGIFRKGPVEQVFRWLVNHASRMIGS